MITLDMVYMLDQCRNFKLRMDDSILNLLKKAGERAMRRHQNLITNALGLLKDSKLHIKEIEEMRIHSAPDFNVFSALGIIRKEVIQSRFLAYLLSPTETHNQGDIFLKAFLQQLDIQISDTRRARVIAERSAGEYLGRMDIVIDCKPWLVVIENKIDAGEGINQLLRYRQWLARQRGYDEDKKRLIFLTPSGHESITGAVGSYQQCSYSNLADSLAILLKGNTSLLPSVSVILTQYVSACRLIGGESMTTQDKELQELLTRPENLRAALEIEQQAALARKRIAKIFTSNVAEELRAKMASTLEVNRIWKAIDS